MTTFSSVLPVNSKHVHVQALHNNILKSSPPMKLNKLKMASPARRKNISIFANAAIEKKITRKSNSNSVNSSIIGGDGGGFGRLVQDGLVYSQNFLIRSFEIGFDKKLSMASLTHFLQDTALNHWRIIGLQAGGFASTPEMSKKDLIWVFRNFQILVDRYPSWLDVVEVENWIYPSGLNSLGHVWLIRDAKTGDTVAQATSVKVLMNKKTRKLSKFTKEIREELAPFTMNCGPITNKHNTKLQPFDVNTADYIRAGLTPGWNDLDVNGHVNHAQYINWILENIPSSMMENYKLSAIILEYKKECFMNSVLHSLSKIVKDGINSYTDNKDVVELEHLLLLENGSELVRGKTTWKPKEVNHFTNAVHISAEETTDHHKQNVQNNRRNELLLY